MSKKKRSAAKRKKSAKKRPKGGRKRPTAARRGRTKAAGEGPLRLPSQGKVPSEKVDLLTATFEEPEGTYHMKERDYRDWWRATFDWASRAVVRPAGEIDDQERAAELFELAARLYELGATPAGGNEEEGFVHPLVGVASEIADHTSAEGGAE